MKFHLSSTVSALSYGLLGRRPKALTPSLLEVGPNFYLAQRDFLRMLGVAFGIHALLLGILSQVPYDMVTHIPVRALSFKLGDTTAVNAPIAQQTAAMSAPMKPMAAAASAPKMTKPAKATPQAEDPVSARPTKAFDRTPKQFVRENGGPPPQTVAQTTPQSLEAKAGALAALAPSAAEQEARARYEQQISAWIQQHKFYPADADGREGRVVVRMRIDRMGNLRYYAIEESANVSALDRAALDMIRRANPMPAVPLQYPAGNLVEFLIPISFAAPR